MREAREGAHSHEPVPGQVGAFYNPEERRHDQDDSGKLSIEVNPEIPWNYKWFKGEFHTAAWGADASPLGGRPEGRVRIAMMGKKIQSKINNGIASVCGIIVEVKNPKDASFLGQSSWWRIVDLSDEGKEKAKKTT